VLPVKLPLKLSTIHERFVVLGLGVRINVISGRLAEGPYSDCCPRTRISRKRIGGGQVSEWVAIADGSSQWPGSETDR